MPFGHNRGSRLRDIPDDELRRTREWCREKDDAAHTSRFRDLIIAIDEELEDRQGLPLFDH
jgi:hypothetical protein